MASKPLLLFSVPIGASLDSYFAAASISGVLVAICSTLLLPEVVPYLGDATGDEAELRKRTGDIICMAFMVGTFALSLYFLFVVSWSLTGHAVGSLFREPLLIFLTFFAIMSQTCIVYIMRMLRLCESHNEADILAVATPFSSSVIPILFVNHFGIYGYAAASSLSLAILLSLMLNKLNVILAPLKTQVVIRFVKTSVKVLPIAFSTKLFPFVEIYSIGLLGSGVYSLYVTAKSVVMGLNGLVDLGYSQRIFAKCQSYISHGQYVELFARLRSFFASLVAVFAICITFCFVSYSFRVVDYAGSLLMADRARLALDLAESVLFFAPLLPATILLGVNIQILFSLKDVRYVSNVAWVTFAVGSSMMIIFPASFGLIGAAIAVSIYHFLNGLIFSGRALRLASCSI